MKENKILVPVDFSQVNDKSLAYASMLAKRGNMNMTLLHVETGKPDGTEENNLKSMAESILKKNGIDCDYVIRKGNIFTEIPVEANNMKYRLMVIGSHGIKGIREKITGADILKLVKMIPIPAIIIQKDYKIPEEGIKTIVFPASSHDFYKYIINAAILLASLYKSKVHLYTVNKPGTEWPEELKVNIELAKQLFEDNNIDFVRVNEDQASFSAGYSKQILQYANKVSADLIAMISVQSKEYYHIADSDKEAMLTNNHCIPVLCTSDKIVFNI